MLPEGRDPLDPAEWLRRARSNLARARAGRVSADALYEDACFDAQQAAEKAVKAVLVQKQIPFPKTHAIERLLGLAAVNGIDVTDAVKEASLLTAYATFSRYPGPANDVTKQEYEHALELAEMVMRWAQDSIAG